MDYIVGIDGGGTKAHFCAADANQTPLWEGFGGGTNLCTLPESTVKETLKGLFDACHSRISGSLRAICIGSAGITNPGVEETMRQLIMALTGCRNIIVCNDALIALRANLGHENGLSMTAGTGTICLACDAAGNTWRYAGWGHVFSDEGSAYYMVKKAMEKVCLAHEGRLPPTALTAAFMARTNAESFEDMNVKLYGEYYPKDRFASLAPVVDDCARGGDAAAIDVLTACSDKLFEMAKFAADTAFGEGTAFKLVQNGSVFTKCAPVKERFDELMQNAFPPCTIELASRPAVTGALLMAARLLHG